MYIYSNASTFVGIKDKNPFYKTDEQNINDGCIHLFSNFEISNDKRFLKNSICDNITC